MEAGESLGLLLQAYWSPEDLLPHDFSIVVWAEKSPVAMNVRAHNHQSKSFPNYKLSDNVIIYDLNDEPIDRNISIGGDTEGGDVEDDKTEDEMDTFELPYSSTSIDAIFNDHFRYALEKGNTVDTSIEAIGSDTFR